MPEHLRPHVPSESLRLPSEPIGGGFGLPAIVLGLAILSMAVWAVFAILGANSLGPTAPAGIRYSTDSSCEVSLPKPIPHPPVNGPVVP